MTPILVYSPEEAKRNAYVVQRFADTLGTRLVTPDYRGDTSYVVNRSNDSKIAKYYEDNGIPVFNGAEFCALANDKQACYDFMESRSIPILPTRYKAVPFVKKPRDSHGGLGVELCHSLDDYDEDFVCQKPAGDLGRDLRVWVLDGEIICSILRYSDVDFRSNYCLGGNAKIYTMSNEEKAFCQKIIDTVTLMGAKYYAVDFLFDNGKLIFNELEDTVGARMIYDLTDIDIIGLYMDKIKNIWT